MVNELTILKSIHVLAAVWWVGGAFVLVIAMTLAARSPEPAPRLAAMRLAVILVPSVFVPLAAIVLASGLWLTADYHDFDELWIQLGMAGLIVAISVALLYMRPRLKRAIAGIEAGAGPPPGRNWVPTVARLNTLLIAAVVVIMVIRPG